MSFIYRRVIRYCLQGKPYYSELQGNLHIPAEMRNFTQARVRTLIFGYVNGRLQGAETVLVKSLGILLI